MENDWNDLFKVLIIIVKDYELNGIFFCFKVVLCDSCVIVSIG